MNDKFIIGLCGHARSRKDTFCRYAKIFLSKKKVGAARVAFADALKEDLDSLCRHKIGMSAFTDDKKEKEILRPLLVAYGTHVMRELDDKWWIDRLKKTIATHEHMELTPIITDVRYPNEMEWIQKERQGICVYITRKGIGPANSEEKKNNSILKKYSDYRMMWPTYGEENIEKCNKHVRRVMNKVLKSNIKCS